MAQSSCVIYNKFKRASAITKKKRKEKNDTTFIGSAVSTNIKGDIINNHFNEYYIVNKDVDETKLKLDPEEVSEVTWVDKDEIIKRIKNNFDGITDKEGCWEYLVKYYEWADVNK